MIQVYHIKMDDGSRFDLSAYSAGEAMYLACHQHRGHTAVDCYLGNDLSGKEDEGRIRFDIPHHKPIPVKAEPGRQRMCAKYIKAGDVIDALDGDWIVEDITALPASVSFGCRDQKFRGRTGEIVYRQNVLVTVTRPEPAPLVP